MKLKSFCIFAACLAVMLTSIQLMADHSLAAQYDRQKPVTLKSAVTKLDWINPHARFLVDVKGSNGQVVNWEVELGPPAGLMRRGWTRNSLKIGESVTVDGFLAKTGVLTSQMPAP